MRIVYGKKYGDVKDCAETPTPTPETPTPTPETPAPTPEVTELPRTGASDVIISGLGLGALVTASIAYVASRRSIIG
jgi:LPXTG-motif cell wall-anchored protein